MFETFESGEYDNEYEYEAICFLADAPDLARSSMLASIPTSSSSSSTGSATNNMLNPLDPKEDEGVERSPMFRNQDDVVRNRHVALPNRPAPSVLPSSSTSSSGSSHGDRNQLKSLNDLFSAVCDEAGLVVHHDEIDFLVDQVDLHGKSVWLVAKTNTHSISDLFKYIDSCCPNFIKDIEKNDGRCFSALVERKGLSA
jgi:hypothetical protein